SLPQRAYAEPRLSPDGQRIMVLMEDAQDLWIYDSRGSSIRLTSDGLSGIAAWSRDGNQAAFSSGRITAPSSGGDARGYFMQLFMQPSDGGGEARRIRDGDSVESSMLAARLGKNQSLSPDGRYAAYVSAESGRDDIYVTSYPGPGGKFPVSTDGGTQPVWARNGELFYRNGTGMMTVDISTTPNLRIGQTKTLFEG